MKELLKKVTEGQNLTREEAAKAMDMMLEGTASPVLVSAFLTALRMKGETVDEIVGCTEMMKSKGGSVKLDTDEYIELLASERAVTVLIRLTYRQHQCLFVRRQV